ncbi:Meiosis specific protein SPO22 [Ceraceosorus bombacis]|uniref:Meiosis specific protein SPO22 n=1 Tax=Ceraceosorus bombacis TaxID=401625 RepID=A0A0P1BCI0_9BASI|nr:Meiosis specific protein SPO22 [Ceraceosorus bombacis]
MELCRQLDVTGCELWNATVTSQFLERGRDNKGLVSFLASTRTSACLLMELGLRDVDELETRSRLLGCYGKTASSLCKVDELDQAKELSRRAAQLDDALSKRLKEPPGAVGETLSKSDREAGVSYSLAQFDIALVDNADELATAAIDRAEEYCGTDRALSGQVATACLSRGTSHLRAFLSKPVPPQADLARRAIFWLQRATRILEAGQESDITRPLLIRCLRKLARAHCAFARIDTKDFRAAEAALKEVSDMYNEQAPHEFDTRLALLHVEVLQLRSASELELLPLYKKLFQHMKWTEETVNRTLILLRPLDQARALHSNVFSTLINAAASKPSERGSFVGRILFTFLVSCRQETDLDYFENMLNVVAADDEIRMDQADTMALMILIWRRGDTLSRGRKPQLQEASRAYGLGTHRAFFHEPGTVAKSIRKVALCQLELNNPQSAMDILANCPASVANDASNHFVAFICAMRLGSKEMALQAFDALVCASNFLNQMLPMVIQEAQQAGFTRILLRAMSETAIRARNDAEFSRSLDLTLLGRTIIKAHLPTSDQNFGLHDAEQLLLSFKSSLAIFQAGLEGRDSNSKLPEECEWVAKTAYNTAIQLADSVDPGLITQLFDIASELTKEDHKRAEQVQLTVELAMWEAHVRTHNYSGVQSSLQAMTQIPVAEAAAEMLWRSPETPKEMLMRAVNKVIGLMAETSDPARYLRWIRALVSLHLEGNGPPEVEVLEAFQSAVAYVIEAQRRNSQTPPRDEILWLLATAWDCGMTLWQ